MGVNFFCVTLDKLFTLDNPNKNKNKFLFFFVLSSTFRNLDFRRSYFELGNENKNHSFFFCIALVFA